MDWKDISQAVGKAAPLLGTLLGGPAGAAVGGLVASALGTDNTAEAVSTALANPDALVKLKQIEADRASRFQELVADQAKAEMAASVQNAQDINKTMQAEAAADHWPTYSWRPFIGFMFGAYIASLWLLPLLHVTPATLTPDMTLAIGGILGVASWFRGKMQADPGVKADNRG